MSDSPVWDAALAFVWRPENDGADNNSAPGEAFLTRWGVIEATWDTAADEGIVDGDLRDATKDDLATILRAMFWNVLGGDRLVVDGVRGAALMIFNMGMVAGVGRSAKLLQRIVGVAQDGQVGPHTIAAAAAMNQHDLILALEKADDAFFASCRQANRFLRGWTRRVTDARVAALALDIVSPTH